MPAVAKADCAPGSGSGSGNPPAASPVVLCLASAAELLHERPVLPVPRGRIGWSSLLDASPPLPLDLPAWKHAWRQTYGTFHGDDGLSLSIMMHAAYHTRAVTTGAEQPKHWQKWPHHRRCQWCHRENLPPAPSLLPPLPPRRLTVFVAPIRWASPSRAGGWGCSHRQCHCRSLSLRQGQ